MKLEIGWHTSSTLSLDDEKVNSGCSQEETTRKYIAVTEIDIANDERGKEAKKEVP